MIPTRRLAFALFAVALAFAAGRNMPGFNIALYAVDAGIVVLVVADALMLRGKRLEFSRDHGDIFSIGRKNAITLRVDNRSGRRLAIELTDDPVDDLEVEGLPTKLTLAARDSKLVTYQATPTTRGVRTFGAITARYSTFLGLLRRQERIEVPGSVDVYPDVHAARALELLRRRGTDSASSGSLRVRGGDTEFERLRPYQRGDEVRHVDWRATARKDDVVVRQFQAESNQNVVFLLDTGRGMRGEFNQLSYLDHALNAALLTADVALRGGDKAGLCAFASSPTAFLMPTGGKNGGRKLTRAAYALQATLEPTNYEQAVAYTKTRIRSRSLYIVLTNLLEPRAAKELAAAMKGLLPHHLPLCVLLRDTDIEALAVAPIDVPQDAYVRAAAAEQIVQREAVIRSLRQAGVLVLDTSPADLTGDLVKRYLEVKARRLL
jgi:uncharacterized protein (DUF58 family)